MTFTPELFTEKERKIIERYKTPYQVQQFLNRMPYNHEKNGDTCMTTAETDGGNFLTRAAAYYAPPRPPLCGP